MGKPFTGNQFGNLSPIERFRKHIKVSSSGCWEFQLKPNKCGYCVISVLSKDILAHRFSYMHFIGELSSIKELVCHKCDNKICVNPFHLFKGDHKDNYHDGQSKGLRPVAICPSLMMYKKGCRCEGCVNLFRENRRKSTARYAAKNPEKVRESWRKQDEKKKQKRLEEKLKKSA